MIPSMAFFKLNVLIINLLGHKISKSARIWSTIKFSGIVTLQVGEDSFIGDSCIVTGGESTVYIGDYCDVSSNVSFVTGSHKIDFYGNHLAGEGYSSDIRVGNRVWIGFGCIVLGGVKIGNNVIIAAGSLVNKDIPDNIIYGGVPAKFIRDL